MAEGLLLAYDPSQPIVIHGVPRDPNIFVRVSIDVIVEGKENVKVVHMVDDLTDIGDLLHTPIPWPRNCVRLRKQGEKVIILIFLDYYPLIRV